MRERERGSSPTVREGASYAVFTPSLTVGLPPLLSANPFTQHYESNAARFRERRLLCCELPVASTTPRGLPARGPQVRSRYR